MACLSISITLDSKPKINFMLDSLNASTLLVVGGMATLMLLYAGFILFKIRQRTP
ncbi:hypothetical protein PMIT1323_00922 [Prochlorococcus marinus str. MIT 1323]|nr:hypothetical protein PMIT1323_00922 [Prochlorococcus marinus str. MIT 1323]